MSPSQIPEIIHALKNRGEMLALAESCTGGMIASQIVDIPGASSVLDRGYVTYTNAAKIDCLGVPKDILNNHGAVSSECASAMALGTLKNSDAQWSIAVTGIAGPDGGNEKKPVGLVYISVGNRDTSEYDTRQYIFNGSRTQIREQAAEKALQLLHARLAHAQ